MNPLARKSQLIIEDLIGECVVYDKTCKKAHSLNSTITWIWHHCDGSTNIEEMVLCFDREFGSSDSLSVILSGIQQLEAANLLVSTDPKITLNIPVEGPSMSRRSVVRAGAVLSPVIASIIVPTAAEAASGQARTRPTRFYPWSRS